jgi:type IV pilus assembly protein PilF
VTVHRLSVVLLPWLLIGCVTTDPIEEGKRRQVADANTQLGVQYLQRGQIPIAISRLERALEAVPDHPQAHNMMGLIQWRLGRSEEAEQHFRTAIEADPNNSEAHNNLGVFLCSRDRIEEAVRQFDRALANPLYTARAEAEENAGKCLLKKGDAIGAENRFRNALAVNPKQREALYEMGKISYTTGQMTSARGFLQRFFQVGKNTPDALLLAVRVEQALGNKGASNSFATQLKGEFPESPQAKALASLGIR